MEQQDRSKLYHFHHERLILSGDVETNPGPAAFGLICLLTTVMNFLDALCQFLEKNDNLKVTKELQETTDSFFDALERVKCKLKRISQSELYEQKTADDSR